MFIFSVVLFFFQAEDGIRDGHVTGVQTCALPISFPDSMAMRTPPPGTLARENFQLGEAVATGKLSGAFVTDVPPLPQIATSADVVRSEERRVGKECRSRWLAESLKKK